MGNYQTYFEFCSQLTAKIFAPPTYAADKQFCWVLIRFLFLAVFLPLKHLGIVRIPIVREQPWYFCLFLWLIFNRRDVQLFLTVNPVLFPPLLLDSLLGREALAFALLLILSAYRHIILEFITKPCCCLNQPTHHLLINCFAIWLNSVC